MLLTKTVRGPDHLKVRPVFQAPDAGRSLVVGMAFDSGASAKVQRSNACILGLFGAARRRVPRRVCHSIFDCRSWVFLLVACFEP